MSAVVSPNSNGSNVVNFKSSTRRNFLQYLVKLSTVETELIADLSSQSEFEIIETRRNAEKLGKSQWRIEVACDAELVGRAKRQAGGRGHKDESETGIESVIKKRANQIGVTPATVRNNVKICDLMQRAQTTKSGLPTLEILGDKGYFLTALKAVDPVSAVSDFAEEKSKDAAFRVSDAGRLLEKNAATKTSANKNALTAVREQSGSLTKREREIANLKAAKKIVIDQILPYFQTGRIREEIWDPLLTDIDSEIGEVNDEDAKTALLLAWSDGCHREDEMAEHSGFPLETVSRIMSLLDDTTDLFILVPRSGQFKTWHKVGVHPYPIELRGGAPKSLDNIRYDR